MTSPMPPMCLWCARFHKDYSCDSFPEGIPHDILFEFVDHRFERRGDQGLRFVQGEDDAFGSLLNVYDSVADDRAMNVDEALAEFCRSAGLNPTPLLALRRRSHSRVTWETSYIGTEEEMAEAEKSESPISPIGMFGTPPIAQIHLGVPGEVIVTLEEDGDISVSELGVHWFGVALPVAFRRVKGEVRIPLSASLVERSEQVADAVQELRRRRRSRFRRCARCTEMTPPEWWLGDGHCQGCASKYLGVVF